MMVNGAAGTLSGKIRFNGRFLMDDRTFVLLFFPSLFISLGVFFWGVGQVWRVSIENREAKRRGA